MLIFLITLLGSELMQKICLCSILKSCKRCCDSAITFTVLLCFCLCRCCVFFCCFPNLSSTFGSHSVYQLCSYLTCCSYFLQMEERRHTWMSENKLKHKTWWTWFVGFGKKIICMCVSSWIRDWLMSLLNCGWNRWWAHNLSESSCLIIWIRVHTQHVLFFHSCMMGDVLVQEEKKTVLKMCMCLKQTELCIWAADERFRSGWVKLLFHSGLKHRKRLFVLTSLKT